MSDNLYIYYGLYVWCQSLHAFMLI